MSPASASDERLARRAAGGDPHAFEEIFRRYEQDLYRFCVGVLREPQDAQDAVQNTMVKALRALPGETRAMQLKPWLYRIAHNEAVELRRRERVAEPLGPTVDDLAAGTEERVELEARLQTLLADIADLPERQRASLVMRELSGLEFAEIGAALGTSAGAARQALYEARRGLSQMESGRAMDCDQAMRQVSDADGAPSRRNIRAHLRDCSRCSHFQAEIRARQETLAAISPLPLVVAATLLKGALGGSGSGAVAAAGGSSAVAGATGAGVGAGGFGAAGAGAGAGGGGIGFGGGVLGVSGLVKAGAGLIAAVAVGTVAIDHGAILGRGADSAAAGERPARTRPVEAAGLRSGGPVDPDRRPLVVRHRAEPSSVRRGTRAAADAAREGPGPALGRGTHASAAEPAGGSGRSSGTAPAPSAQTTPISDPSPGSAKGEAGRAPAPGGAGGEPPGGADRPRAEAADGDQPRTEVREEKDGAKSETKEAKDGAKSDTKEAKGQTKSEAKAERSEAKTEAKAEKGEAKAERTEVRAEAKAEKSEARAEKKEAKGEAKAEKADAKEPAESIAQAEAPPAESTPAAEPTEPAPEAASGQTEKTHGKSGKKEAPAAE